jgi:hypothetical protein
MKKLLSFTAIILAAAPCFLAAQNVLPGYNGFWDRNRRISVLDILEYYPDRLPYLRNEVYARYGRPFATRAYQDYFYLQGWYRIRSDYSDDWLSAADRYNAELIRAIEQAPSAGETLSLLGRNAEYQSRENILVFGAARVIESDRDEYFEIYGGNTGADSPYLVIGDWVILYDDPSSGFYRVTAYRLDHKARAITASTRGRIPAAVFTPLVRAQDRLRDSLR